MTQRSSVRWGRGTAKHVKKAIFILLLSIFALLYYMGFLTQKETLPFSKEFFAIEISPSSDRAMDLRAVWPFKGRPIDPGALSGNTKELDQVHLAALERGIKNLPVLSSLFLLEAEKARRAKDHDRAVRLATYAVQFSPDMPQPYFKLARTRWSQNPIHLHQVVPDLFKGLVAQFRYYPISLPTLYNLLFIVSNAMLMTFLLFGIMILMKYLPLYFYDIQKSLTQEVSRLIINSFKILFLFIPFFLRLDMLWALLFWTILLWGYVSKRERQLIFFFFIVVIYFPFFLRTSSAFLNTSSSEVILEMHRANYEVWDGENEHKLQAWLATHPDDAEVLFTVGLIDKRRGGYFQAEKSYQKAIQQDGQWDEAYSNLGNVYLAQKEPASAIASYEKAVGLNPSKASYHFNLYRAYSLQTFLSSKSDRAFQKARQLDPQLIDLYSTIETPSGSVPINRLVIDETLPEGRLWKRFLSYYSGPEGWLFRLFKAWFEKIPSRASFLVPILFLGFLVGMSRYSRAKRFLTRCPMCGSPTHRFYLGASDQEFICFNCYRIFVQKEKLHPKIVEKKSLQVQQFQKEAHVISRFLSFFFMGFGYLWKGYFYRGLLFLFLFFVFILKWVYWQGVLDRPSVGASQTFWGLLLWAGLFVLIYFLTLRQIYGLKPKFRRELSGS